MFWPDGHPSTDVLPPVFPYTVQDGTESRPRGFSESFATKGKGMMAQIEEQGAGGPRTQGIVISARLA